MLNTASGITAWPAARPLIKWSGGKTGELAAIRSGLPAHIGMVAEPFAGGGAFMFALPSGVRVEANDRSADLVALYRLMASADAGLMAALVAIDRAWRMIGGAAPDILDQHLAAIVRKASNPLAHLLGARFPSDAEKFAAQSLRRKRRFLEKLGEEASDGTGLLLSAMKSGLYTALRASYNNGVEGATRAAIFWFLRDFCFGGMFRTNARGAFNVPYGGVSYNSRSMEGRIAQLADPATSARLAATGFTCGDFEQFLRGLPLTPEDFVFLDPPYDSRFSTYDGNAFTHADHIRLATWMTGTAARWMLVISATDFVRETYCTIPGAFVSTTDKLYLASIKNRHSRAAVHLMVTNYPQTPENQTSGC